MKQQRNLNGLYRCALCKNYKEKSYFNKNKSDKYGISRYCSDCNKKNSRENTRIVEAENKKLLIEVKNQPCKDCKKTFPYYAMHFDHITNNKLYNVGAMLSHNKNKLIKEIEKCEVVCANCHFIRTFNRKNAKNKIKKLTPSILRNVNYINNIKIINVCVDCHQNFHFSAMQFDHTNPFLKRREIARLIQYSLDVIKQEISKCELVCANCHAVRTYNRMINDKKLSINKKVREPQSIKNSDGGIKLTKEQVIKIRELYEIHNYTQKELVMIFGISRCMISFIIKRKRWAHV